MTSSTPRGSHDDCIVSAEKRYRTIRLSLSEAEYDRFIQDRPYAKSRLEELHELHPELFPEAFDGAMPSTASPTPLVNKSCVADGFGLRKGVKCSP